jgi:hypothetical protein
VDPANDRAIQLLARKKGGAAPHAGEMSSAI